MFFLIFSASIRIFTLFLNFSDTEKIIIPAILIFGCIRTYFLIKKKKSENKNHDIIPFHEGIKLFGKTLLRGILGNLFATLVICFHLYIKNPDYVQYFFEIKKYEFTTPNRETFNDFVRISDTQKYHKYYAETDNGKIYSLSSEKDYHIGDQIFLSASKKDLDFSNIFSSTGNTIFSSTFWNYEFNYDKRLFMKGVDGTLYEKTSLNANCIGTHNGELDKQNTSLPPCKSITIQGNFPNFKPLGKIDKARIFIQSKVISKIGQNKYSGLLLGLLIGDKSMIPSENYDTFVDSGLVHIIAVSGGNIAMVLILLGFLFSRLPFYIKNIFLIFGIILYALLCGNDASVIRAAIMGSLTLIALFRGREISIRRAMLYAFFTILIINPFSLGYDIGFILSFSAIIGIVLFQKISDNRGQNNNKKLNNKEKKSDFFQSKFRKEYLVPTIGASLGTAPILIFFMNGVNLLGIILNIFIVPIIPIVTIYGFICTILSIITGRGFWIRPEKLLMNLIYGLSTFGAKYAIFLQNETLRKKYILVGLFIGLGIFAYRKITHKTKNKKSDKKQHHENIDSHDILDNVAKNIS